MSTPRSAAAPHRPAPAPPAPPPARPGTVLALLVTGTLAGLAAVVGAALALAGGRDLARSEVEENLGTEFPEGTLDPFSELLIDERHDQLVARAVVVLVFAIPLLLCTFLGRKAATWARVLITVTALLTVIGVFVLLDDAPPTSLTASGVPAIVCCLAAVVTCWLPATGRYARQRKAVRAAARQQPAHR